MTARTPAMPLRDAMRLGHPQADARIRDLGARPEQSLAHGRLADQERAGDVAGGSIQDGAQRERDSTRQGQGGVAAREQQPKPVIAERSLVLGVGPRSRTSRLSDLQRTARALLDASPTQDVGRSSMGGDRSHAAGLTGMPSRGQRRSARSAASWKASSARSQSPVARMSPATMRSRSAATTDATTRVGRRSSVATPRAAADGLPVSRPRVRPWSGSGAARCARPTPWGSARPARSPRPGPRTRGSRTRRSIPCCP